VAKSVFADHLVCLDCGKHYSMLNRHLRTDHKLTVDQYRQRWGLSFSNPMVSPDYAKTRSALAKKIGLGRQVQVRRGRPEERWLRGGGDRDSQPDRLTSPSARLVGSIGKTMKEHLGIGLPPVATVISTLPIRSDDRPAGGSSWQTRYRPDATHSDRMGTVGRAMRVSMRRSADRQTATAPIVVQTVRARSSPNRVETIGRTMGERLAIGLRPVDSPSSKPSGSIPSLIVTDIIGETIS
jgi:hypothetical protein